MDMPNNSWKTDNKQAQDSVLDVSLQNKLMTLGQYDLTLDASINWKFVRNNSHKTFMLLKRQSNNCKKMKVLAEELLGNLQIDNYEAIEQEVYTSILNTANNLCNISAKYFSDYSGLNELYAIGSHLVKIGKLNPEKFLKQTMMQDLTYVQLADMQCILASVLKDALDPEIIRGNPRYQKLTEKLVKNYCFAMKNHVRRNIDHNFYMSTDALISYYKVYLGLTNGLAQDVLDIMDQSVWFYALDDIAKKLLNGAEFKKEFLLQYLR
ncbi:MAG: hypothetical protein VB089_04635 [Anaerolineaceae bacterium]|jgi:hypothetical protein|nr:hypothetical protein [Anaerolineaceae bacterium]